MRQKYEKWISELFTEIWGDFLLVRRVNYKTELHERIYTTVSLVVCGYFKKQWENFFKEEYFHNAYWDAQKSIVNEISFMQKRTYFELDFKEDTDYKDAIKENNEELNKDRLRIEEQFIKTLDTLIKEYRRFLNK